MHTTFDVPLESEELESEEDIRASLRLASRAAPLSPAFCAASTLASSVALAALRALDAAFCLESCIGWEHMLGHKILRKASNMEEDRITAIV
jgi:hypothetical protein